MIAFTGLPKGRSIVFTDQATFSSPEFARDLFVTDQPNGDQLSRPTQPYEVSGSLANLGWEVEFL